MENRIYDEYEYGELGEPDMHTQLLPLLSSGQEVLDIGFGAGHMCSPVAFAGLFIDGVDRNEYMLDRATDLFFEAGLSDQLTTIHSEALEFLKSNTKKYDLVIMSDFLMFQTKTQGTEMIKLAFEALRENGLFWIVALSTGDRLYSHLAKSQKPIDKETFTTYSCCGGSGPVCFYFPQEIEKMLQVLGGTLVFSNEVMNSAGAMVNIILVRKP